MRKILILFLLCLAAATTKAASPIPEALINKGDTMLLFSLPLEQMQQTDPVKYKRFTQRIAELNRQAGRKVVGRGYRALYAIDKDTLRLARVYDEWMDNEVAVNDLLPRGSAATWFSGDLRASWEGKTVFQSDNLLERRVERETIFKVDKGHIRSSHSVRNRLVGDQKNFYEKVLPGIAGSFMFPPMIDSVRYESVYVAFTATPNKLGRITELEYAKMVLYNEDGTHTIVDDIYHPYLRELLRRLEAVEPYAVLIEGKIRPITTGMWLKSRGEAKNRP